MKTRRRVWLSGAVLAVVVCAGLGAVAVARRPSGRVDLGQVAYVGSDACVDCHEPRYDSWHRTFHRTMTQPATPNTVLGAFDGGTLKFAGGEARFDRTGGAFVIEATAPDGGTVSHEVVRTVGSRRIQQYLTKEADRFVRLPVAWLIAEQRWTHLNAVFFSPDDTPFNEHRALWNVNCVFCHNVKANPGYDWETKTFATEVAELGIGCEACHGPGAEHLRRTATWGKRLWVQSGLTDSAIVSPRELPPDRARQLCGHCHGQRLPNPLERIRSLMSEGDPYTAGEDLLQYVTPLQQGSHLDGVEVRLRFWGDGSPRLSAYELQSLEQSDAHLRAGVTCLHCHSAHEGDPRGMITEEKRGNAACTGCHGSLSRPAQAAAHSRHPAGSEGSECRACHMPRTVFGILTAHPSHRIDMPDPSRAWLHGMPEACTQCHVDRSARWAAVELLRQDPTRELPRLPQSWEFETSETVRGLLAGDPVRRALAVLALGTLSADEAWDGRLWAVPFLLLAAEDDYPVVRHLAWRVLGEARAALGRGGENAIAASGLPPSPPEPLAPEEVRAVQLAAWRSWWAGLDKSGLRRPSGEVPLDDDWEPARRVIEALRAQRSDVPIHVGE